MRLLITGGLGNLGSWLTEFFVEKKFEVTTFSMKPREVLNDLSFEKIYGDIANENDVDKLIKERNWDVIIHLASINEGNAPGYAKKALDINAWGTRNLLQALVNNGKTATHLIYFSTFHVYGINAGDIVEDTTQPQPKNDYGTTHLFAEYYIRQFHSSHKIPFTIFRLTNSYGCPKEMTSSKWYLVLNDLARSAVETKLIKLNSNGRPMRDFIWMGDVCNIVDKFITKGPANDVFNLGMGRSISMMDVAEIVQQAWLEYFSEPIPIQVNTADTTAYDTSLKVSVDKLKNLVGFSPTDKILDEAKSIFRLLTNKN